MKAKLITADGLEAVVGVAYSSYPPRVIQRIIYPSTVNVRDFDKFVDAAVTCAETRLYEHTGHATDDGTPIYRERVPEPAPAPVKPAAKANGAIDWDKYTGRTR